MKKLFKFVLVWVALAGVLPAMAQFKDIKIDLTDGAFLTEAEIAEQTLVTFGISIADDGTQTRVAADDSSANIVLAGKFHSKEHGWTNFSAQVPNMTSYYKVGMGACAWGGNVALSGCGGEDVVFNTNNGTCFHQDKVNNIVYGYVGTLAEALYTLTISGGNYTPYISVEAIDPSEIPSAGDKPAVEWKDIDLNLVESPFLEANEKDENARVDVSLGLVIGEDGSVTRVAADDASANITLSGKWWNSHGWNGVVAKVAVDGPVDITVGACQYGDENIVVTDASGAEVLKFVAVEACGTPVTGTYTGGATTLTITCTGYFHAFAVKKSAAEEEKPAVVGDVTAVWNFRNDLPAGICEATNYQKVTAEVPSTVDGIVMTVDATNGKLYCIGRDNAQFNQGTILRVPVQSAKDTVSVEAYPGYCHLTVGGEADADGDNIVSHRATSAEAAQGYVEVVSTGSSYIYGVKVVQVSMIQEKQLYSTNFSDWTKAGAATSESKVEQKTKYSKEDLTFTLYNTAVDPAGVNSKFNNGEALGWLQAAKAADPYVQTSTLASVSKVRYVHAATGSNRGWKLEAKGDGDADWVTISETVANPAAWCEVVAEVNRTNVQLRWTNLNASQNAYMFELDIYGNVDLSKSPVLGSFNVNGKAVSAIDVFAEQADGINTATVELPKAEKMISTDNPLTDVLADNGEVTSVEYEAGENSTVATIKVTANGDEAIYKVTFLFKPDFTLTYYNADGSVIGTQTVEKDATIGAFAYSEANVTVGEGQKFRGWFVEAKENRRKYTVDEVVVADMGLYAIVTDIEVASDNARYYYPLNNLYFYAEDHEGFNLTGTGCFHDNQHGWTVNNGDKVELLVGRHAYILLGLCRYGNESTITLTDAKGNVVGTAKAPVETDGQSAAFEYTGEPGVITLTCDNGIYLHDITIINDANNSITRNEQGYFMVKAGNADSFLATLEVANASASNNERTYIFIPDGTYDLGAKALTKVSGNNISLIGQSMDNTIIVNCPEEEGIGVTATLLVTGQNTYFQDLTLKNAMDYYTAATAGRAVCLQDKGARTICKNVKMLSYQDTYYSNAASQFYWETSEIHGCVDFICGGGDVFFNKCLIVCESRDKNSKSGEATITAPYTDAANTFGYVFDGCTIENKAAKFNYGRAWGGVSRLAWLNTTLNQPNEIAEKRFTAAGMNVAADKFVEYNSVDKDGKVVSPASNVVTFTKDNTTNTMETILTAEQAAEYALDKVFTDWTPAVYAAQVQTSEAKNDKGNITWTDVEGAIAYAVFVNGTLADIVNTTSYTVADATAKVEIRTANAMGGFGEAVTAIDLASIEGLVAGQEVKEVEIFTAGGIQLNQLQQGVNIVRTTYANGVVESQKVVK